MMVFWTIKVCELCRFAQVWWAHILTLCFWHTEETCQSWLPPSSSGYTFIKRNNTHWDFNLHYVSATHRLREGWCQNIHCWSLFWHAQFPPFIYCAVRRYQMCLGYLFLFYDDTSFSLSTIPTEEKLLSVWVMNPQLQHQPPPCFPV